MSRRPGRLVKKAERGNCCDNADDASDAVEGLNKNSYQHKGNARTSDGEEEREGVSLTESSSGYQNLYCFPVDSSV